MTGSVEIGCVLRRKREMIANLRLVSDQGLENISKPVSEQTDVFDDRIHEVDLREQHRFDTRVIVDMLECQDTQQIPQRVPGASVHS